MFVAIRKLEGRKLSLIIVDNGHFTIRAGLCEKFTAKAATAATPNVCSRSLLVYGLGVACHEALRKLSAVSDVVKQAGHASSSFHRKVQRSLQVHRSELPDP